MTDTTVRPAKGGFDPISLPSHIRIKRHKLTLFIHTDLRVDTVQVIKERLEKLTGVPVMKQRLYLDRQLILNAATLWDSGVEVEDQELTLAFSTGIGPGDVETWEDRLDALNGPPAALEHAAAPGANTSAASASMLQAADREQPAAAAGQ